MNIFRRFFGERQSQFQARSNHPILDSFLQKHSNQTQITLKRAFDQVHDANIEFTTWIDPDPVLSKKIMDQANSQDIAVWCNNDKKTAFFYGLGKIDRDSVEDVMNWIRGITLVGNKAIVRIVKQDSSDKYIEISM